MIIGLWNIVIGVDVAFIIVSSVLLIGLSQLLLLPEIWIAMLLPHYSVLLGRQIIIKMNLINCGGKDFSL